jgi:hypothetical protein
MILALVATLVALVQGNPVINARLTTGVVRLGSDASIIVDVEGVRTATVGEMPTVDGLHLGPVGSPVFSTSDSWDGRRRVASVRYSFRIPIQAERKGNFTIPPIPVNADGRTLQTPELSLKVVDDLKGEELGYFQIDAPKEIVEGQPFLLEMRFGYDKALGEIGEKVNYLNLMLPWLDQLPGLLELDPPAPTAGAGIVSPIGLNQRGTTRAERIASVTENGRTFLLLRIRKRYLATRSGKLEFPTSHLEFGQIENQTLFSMGPSEKVTFFKRVPAFAIDVLELPEAGRPLDYTNAVGTLNASATVDRRDVDAGDSIKVSVEWTGEGNLEFFDPPDPSRMEAFKDFRLYGTNDRKTPDRRVVTYDLAPITPDAKAIPPIPLVVFDPQKQAYVTIKTVPLPIRVRALKTSSGLAAEAAAKPEPGLDIRDIQTGPGSEGSPKPGGASSRPWASRCSGSACARSCGSAEIAPPRGPNARAAATSPEEGRARSRRAPGRALEAFVRGRAVSAGLIGRDPVAWSAASCAASCAGSARSLRSSRTGSTSAWRAATLRSRRPRSSARRRCSRRM